MTSTPDDTPSPAALEASPIAAVDLDSVTALFLADPTTVPRVDRVRLVTELRRRADVAAAERAAAEADGAAGKRKPRTQRGGLIDAALAAVNDKPVSELTLDDLMGPGGEDA